MSILKTQTTLKRRYTDLEDFFQWVCCINIISLGG
jgi:hypothetical protein